MPKTAQHFLDFTYMYNFIIDKISKLGCYAIWLSFFLWAHSAVLK